MLTFKTTSHANWLTGWLSDKSDKGRTRRGELLTHIKKWKLFLTSPSPSHPHFLQPVNEFSSAPESDFTKANWTGPSSFVCLFTHFPPHTHFCVYCLPVLWVCRCGSQCNLIQEVPVEEIALFHGGLWFVAHLSNMEIYFSSGTRVEVNNKCSGWQLSSTRSPEMVTL